MKTILPALIAVLIATPALAQTPSGIEAVEYDPNGSQWFVSCGSSTMLSTSDLYSMEWVPGTSPVRSTVIGSVVIRA